MTHTKEYDLSPQKKMRARAWLAVAALLLPVQPVLSRQEAVRPEKVRIRDLAPQFQDWLKLVDYIIRDKERDVFLHLQSDLDRNLFIEAFWKLRDPTPATPENEFQQEHVKRFQEANKRFKFGSARDGWMTDQGRIYIILGPPVSKSYFAGSNDLWPAETWSYYGDTSKGMPLHFELLFYQRGHAGEMKLYDPVADGPGRLLIDAKDILPSDYQALFDKIWELQPDIARVSLSIIPGDIPPSFQPSMDSVFYMAAIFDSPKKGLNDEYATHFLNYRGRVSTEYLTNYLKTEAEVALVPDPRTGLMFCDFVLAPERLSVDYYDPTEQYSTNFQLDVSLRVGEDIVFQYSKEYPLTIPASQIEETRSMGMSIADSFPVIPGKFKLSILVRNTVGREFSVFEQEIEVPSVSGPPRLTAPAIGTRLVDTPAGAHLPFQAAGKKLNIDPRKTFSKSDQVNFLVGAAGLTQGLWKAGRISIAVKGTTGAAPYERTFTVPLDTQPFRQVIVYSPALPVSEIPPDYYEMTLVLQDGEGRNLDQKAGQFIISPVNSMAHPIVASRAFSLANSHVFHYMLAHQFDQTGQTAEAEAAYKRALEINPSYTDGIPDYAEFLVKTGKFDEALGLLERIKDNPQLQFRFFLLRGRALAGMGRYDEAILSLQEGNQIYNSDAGLLAVLGTCYYRTGDRERALTALRASLKLDPQQEAVKAMIAEIEKKD